jgi:mono/diheme cytochrome c family protein
MQHKHLVLLMLLGGCPGFGSNILNGLFTEAPVAPNYEDHVSLVMDVYCVSCHGQDPAGGAPDTLRLDVYDTLNEMPGVFESRHLLLDRSLGTVNPMPPMGFTQLDWLERDLLQLWVDNGGPL